MAEPIWKEWISRGEDFLKWARDNFEDGNHQLVGYLCQQSVEFLLKGLLYRDEIIAPKTHDLLTLAKKVKSLPVDWDEFKEELERLSGYYFESRYPGEDAIEVNQEQARQAIKDVEMIWEKVRITGNL